MSTSFSSVTGQLQQGKKVIRPNRGTSMLPLLREGKDRMVISPRPDSRLQKYDAALFKRDNGELVLHRVLKVLEKGYLMNGDHQFVKETVREDQILGILTHVMRGKHLIPVTSLRMRCYILLWYAPYPLRFLFLRANGMLHGIYRRICKNRKV